MHIEHIDISDDFRRISLSGRLDTAGSEAIATRFAALAASARRRVLVDLAGVSFLSSMAIRSLIANAKAQQGRGGRMVLFVGGNTSVAKTLESTGIDVLIPTFADASEAERAVLA